MDSKNIDVSEKRSRVPIDRFADKQTSIQEKFKHYIKVEIIIFISGVPAATSYDRGRL